MAFIDELERIRDLTDKLRQKVEKFAPTQKCFLVFLQEIEELISNSKTIEQAKHYIDQFYTITACMHEEIEVLSGGMLKRKHQTNIHTTTIHEKERGCFDGFEYSNVNPDDLLTCCSVGGILWAIEKIRESVQKSENDAEKVRNNTTKNNL